MMNKQERIKIWQILGNIEGCQELLERAKKDEDWYLVEAVKKYLDKVKERLDSLA